uniref:Uncharacterized protein n=1 Tax=Ceratitis capitata TaxID=7213 RepID=W8C0I1_CERCA
MNSLQQTSAKSRQLSGSKLRLNIGDFTANTKAEALAETASSYLWKYSRSLSIQNLVTKIEAFAIKKPASIQVGFLNLVCTILLRLWVQNHFIEKFYFEKSI